MITLIISCLAITVLVMAAILLPLTARTHEVDDRDQYDLDVYRDQLKEIDHDRARGLLSETEADAAKLEIERRILVLADRGNIDVQATKQKSSKALPIAVGVIVPVIAVGIYVQLGSPMQPDIPFASRDIPVQQARAQGAPHAGEAQAPDADMSTLVDQLAARLEQRPGDVEGWLLLGRSLVSMERFDEARAAYGNARKAANGRLDVEVAYAESIILTSGMTVTEEASQILRTVRAQAPFEPKSRYYLGLKKAQDGDVSGAMQDWVDLVAVSGADAPWLPIVHQQMAEAGQELNVDPASFEPSEEAKVLAQQLASARAQASQAQPSPQVTETARAPGPTQEQMEAAQQMSVEDREQMVRGMVDRLATRLEDEPNDLEGWQRLLRAYRVLGETEKATEVEARVKEMSIK